MKTAAKTDIPGREETGKAGRLLSHVGDGLARTPVVVALIAVVFAMSAALRLAFHLNQDSYWLLVAARRMLDGAALYREILEVNPPLIVWLSVPAVLTADTVGIGEDSALLIFVLMLAAISLWLVSLVLRRIPGLGAREQGALLVAAAIALVLLPGRDTAQREHLLLIFVLPYVLLAGARAAAVRYPTSFAATVGVFAAVGFCLKPYFLLIPLALELLIAVRRRSIPAAFRPETLMVGFGVLSYVGAVAWLAPDYYRIMVPIGLEIYNQTYTDSLGYVLKRAASSLAVAATILVFVPRFKGPRLDLLLAFMTAAAAQFAIFAIQSKGWHYQLVPALGLLFMAIAIVGIGNTGKRQEKPSRRTGVTTRALVAAGLAVLLLAPAIADQRFNEHFRKIAGPIEDLGLSPHSVFFFSAHVWHPFPLAPATGMKYASRSPAQWLMPGIAQREAMAVEDPDSWTPQMDEIVQLAHDSVVRDFEDFGPELVLVHDAEFKAYFHGLRFDYLQWNLEDPRFADIWSNYEKVGEIEGEDVTVYQRRQPS